MEPNAANTEADMVNEVKQWEEDERELWRIANNTRSIEDECRLAARLQILTGKIKGHLELRRNDSDAKLTDYTPVRDEVMSWANKKMIKRIEQQLNAVGDSPEHPEEK